MNYSRLLKQLKVRPRVHGYVSPLTVTRPSAVHGWGLFAAKNILKGTVVAVWGGRVITVKEMKKLPQVISNHYALELSPGFYLAETSIKELDCSDFINHSCAPNCRIVQKFIMVSRRVIKMGEELTADFSSKRKNGHKMVCNCRTPNCRGIIYLD